MRRALPSSLRSARRTASSSHGSASHGSSGRFGRWAIWPALLTVTVALAGCGGGEDGADAATDVTVFEGARLISGQGVPPVDDAVFVVEGSRFVQVGAAGDVEAPEGATRVDLSGKTVIPALVNAHVHLSNDADERAEQLRHMAYYGAGTVVALGHDEGDAPFAMQGVSVEDGARSLTAGRGITTPEPGRSEVPYWVTTPEEARAAVRESAERGVDIIKIWVDSRGGQYERMSPELYQAVIEEAHVHDLKVTAHIFRLEDAKGLLEAGIDAFAHGIRDQAVDDELVQLWLDRPGVVLVPNLPGPGVPVDLSWITTVPAETLAEMEAAEEERPQVQEAFAIQAGNLARLHEEGIAIGFGTDGSTPWAVHLEMEDMVRAGMTPAAVLTAATSTSASLMGLGDVGTIAPAMSADFVVLNADPLQDITNTRDIDAVYLRGQAIDRETIADRLRSAGGE